MGLREEEAKNMLEVTDNENGTKNIVMKQFEVVVDETGKAKAIAKEPITQPGISKEGLLKQKAVLQSQLADVEFLLSKFE
jgi:hypothetical protein